MKNKNSYVRNNYTRISSIIQISYAVLVTIITICILLTSFCMDTYGDNPVVKLVIYIASIVGVGVTLFMAFSRKISDFKLCCFFGVLYTTSWFPFFWFSKYYYLVLTIILVISVFGMLFYNMAVCQLTLIFSVVIEITTFFVFKVFGDTTKLQDIMFIYTSIIILISLYIMGIIVSKHSMLGRQLSDYSKSSEDMLKVVDMKRIEANNAVKARTAFLANTSHEIRTPINSMLGFTELITRDSDDPRVIDYCRSIQAAGGQLMSIVNDILDISRIESAGFSITEAEYDLRTLINEIISINTYVVKNAGNNIHFDCVIDETIPSKLRGDSVRLKQIATNFLNNAFKYTQDGKVSINIGWSRQNKTGMILPANKLILIIKVEDTGIGIKNENLKKICEKYVRLDENRSKSSDGVGLGLYITAYLIEAMGGWISIESEYGKGSTFTAYIPQEIIDYNSVGSFDSNLTESKYISRPVNDDVCKSQLNDCDKSILIVDDNLMNIQVLKGLLRHTSLNITSCTSGLDALSYVNINRYDLIFMDHMMPEMDGVETLNLIRTGDNLCKDTPVIMLTANAAFGSKEKYKKLGFNDYLSKPINFNELEKLIGYYLLNEDREIAADDVDNSSAMDDNIRMLKRLDGPNCNVEKGMAFCMRDADIMIEALQLFTDMHDSMYENLEEALDAEDFKTYAITMHGLKGNARNLGAEKLVDIAYEHELAAKKGDINTLNSKWDILNDSWNELIEDIKEAFKASRLRSS